MSDEGIVDTWRRWSMGVALVAFLVAVYFFTFNGYAVSRDEWFLFDATESMARRGDLRVNYEFDAYPPINLAEATPPPADTEPLQPLLAAPLVWIGEQVPGVGVAQTVWLFSIVVTALTAGVLYAYGLALDYRPVVAVLVALVFGLGTIAWPYSRTFFREPLFTLLALQSAYLMQRTRQRLGDGRIPVLAMILFVLVFMGALLTKEVGLLTVPVIVVEALPARLGQVRASRRVWLALAGIMLLVLLLVITAMNADQWLSIDPNRYSLLLRLEQVSDNAPQTFEGINGYMFSPARSMWVFSPVLLLGFFGWRRLLREHRERQILVPLVMLISFAVGYAAVRGDQWYGGAGWGPRYLVPVTPFVALWLLPVFDTLLENGARLWQRIAVGAICVVSIGVQVIGILVPVTDYPLLAVESYYGTLAAQNPPVIPWEDGVWSLRWSPLTVSFDLLGEQPLDLAWVYAVGKTGWLPLLAVGLSVLAGGWLVWWLRAESGNRRWAFVTTGSLALASVIAVGVGLGAIREDPRYYGDFDPTHNLLDHLEQQVQPDDVIVLSDYEYNEFFMNFYKLREPVVYTLPWSPGQRFNYDQEPQLISSNPEALIHPSNTLILTKLGQDHSRLWLVVRGGPDVSGSIRPVEHYLSRHFFPVSEEPPSDAQDRHLARAVLFDMTSAPPSTATAWPEQPVDAVFGESLRLVGYDIPGGATRAAGDVLPVSLLWEKTAPTPDIYPVGPEGFTIGVYLMAPDGTLVAERNSFPVNRFENTQNWAPGAFYRDNHGLLIPESVLPGEYELWVALYWWQQPAPEDRLPVTNADGEIIGRSVVLTTITVE
ncbi:MAG: hypothetical protein GYB65_19695 [Chloroflexi bacterium]|nr:hypothetical protein [Chloroflexota bacterium]